MCKLRTAELIPRKIYPSYQVELVRFAATSLHNKSLPAIECCMLLAPVPTHFALCQCTDGHVLRSAFIPSNASVSVNREPPPKSTILLPQNFCCPCTKGILCLWNLQSRSPPIRYIAFIRGLPPSKSTWIFIRRHQDEFHNSKLVRRISYQDKMRIATHWRSGS